MKKDEIIKWVVGIVLVIYMIFQLYVSFSFNSSMSEISDNLDEISAPYMKYEEQEAQIETLLTNKGYEVLNVNMFDYTTDAPFYEWYDIERNITCEDSEEPCYTGDVSVSIEMKSLGSKSEQVWDALTSSGVVYPDAFVHWITIKYPTETCKWTIFGVWKWMDAGEDVEEFVETQELIQYQIDELAECS